MFADVAHEVHCAHLKQPFRVVDQPSGRGAVEIQEAGELITDAECVLPHGDRIGKRSLVGSAARVSDHSRSTANDGNREMSGALKVDQAHHGHEVSHMKAGGGWVEARVSRDRPDLQELANAFRVLKQHPTPPEFFEKRVVRHGKNLRRAGVAANQWIAPRHVRMVCWVSLAWDIKRLAHRPASRLPFTYARPLRNMTRPIAPRRSLVRPALVALTFVAAFGIGFAYASWALVCGAGRCPSATGLDQFQPLQTSKIYAADGRLIAQLGLEHRTLVSIADIPLIVREAFIATEDKRFYEHSGIDWHRVPSAILSDIRTRSWSQGFSTITMQLARNIFPQRISREKTLVRKLKEAKVAIAIEHRFSKGKILELYLNQIYFGNGAYGVDAASREYFGKSVRDLNVDEAATLAALPKNPNAYNPRRYPERALQRRNTILELMRAQGMIDNAGASIAKASPMRLASREESGEIAPYFVEYVRQQLDDRFGARVYEQGLNVYTTLDIDQQSAAERALEHQLEAIEAGRYGPYPHVSYEDYIAHESADEVRDQPTTPYLQGAFVVIDAGSGAIRAMVGGRNFDDNMFNRATQALRQPGSTFKPIVYADAIASGRPVSYLLNDSALSVPMGDGSDWTPRDFDGRFLGRIPLRVALYESRNVPAIRMGMELGETSVVEMARALGLTSSIPPYPSIFIGAADVYPIELVSAYQAFATLGVRAETHAIVRVESATGDTLWQPEPTRTSILTPEQAWLMVSMMEDVIRRGTAANSVGTQFPFPAGGKTGTTNNGTDVWFIGFTSNLVAGVWMGFDRPQTIKANAQGGILAAPAWTSFMNEVYSRRPAPPGWTQPPGLIARQIDASTNTLAGPNCRGVTPLTEFFVPGTEPVVLCASPSNAAPRSGTPSPQSTVDRGRQRPISTPADVKRARADSAAIFARQRDTGPPTPAHRRPPSPSGGPY